MQFLSGVKSFTGGESSGVGGAAQPAQAAGGTDWSQLSTLASHFGGAQQEHGDSLDINKFTSLYVYPQPGLLVQKRFRWTAWTTEVFLCAVQPR